KSSRPLCKIRSCLSRPILRRLHDERVARIYFASDHYHACLFWWPLAASACVKSLLQSDLLSGYCPERLLTSGGAGLVAAASHGFDLLSERMEGILARGSD